MEYPRKFQIGFQEGTCPLNCKKCLAFGENARQKKEVRKMSIDKAKHLIDEISQLGIHAVIQPHIFTEPFANPDLRTIIHYCGEKKLDMSIITNGILLDDEWLDFLIGQSEQKLTVSFSLDAVTQEVYEKVRGKYELSVIEQKINYLMEHKKNRNLKISVNFTTEEDNKDEADIFLDRWKYRVDAVRMHTLIDGEKKLLDTFPEEPYRCRECGLLNESMVIDAGGEVRACSLDAFGESYLGNVLEEGICNVWNGKRMENLRKRVYQNSLSKDDFCYGCEAHGIVGNYCSKEDDEFYVVENGYDIFYNRK